MRLLTYNIVRQLPRLPVVQKTIVNTINPHSYCIAKRDKKFREALQNSDFLLPDGIGIVWAAKVLRKEKIERIAGYDLFIHVMRYLEETKGSCFFLGASQATLSLIEQKIALEYPSTSVGSYSPPYKDEFSKEDSLEMCRQVNTFKPEVLFVGMTAPKQEKWVFEERMNLDAQVICSIGAVFDFYAGTVERPSQFWINMGLEWLPRFLKDPKRLAKRNLVSTPKFILDVLYHKYFNKQMI